MRNPWLTEQVWQWSVGYLLTIVGAAYAQDLQEYPYPQSFEVIPQVLEPWWSRPWVGITALGILVAVVIGLFCRSPKTSKVELAADPYIQALQALEALKTQVETSEASSLASQVSVIVREYLQQQFSIPAPYRSSEELYLKTMVQEHEALQMTFAPLAALYDRLAFAPIPKTAEDALNLIVEAEVALTTINPLQERIKEVQI